MGGGNNMVAQIKSIETAYNGYRFRSRLEARWAVFFDTAGIKYLYEPEGFDIGEGTYYLPDFYLPELKMWVEIKGVMSNSDWNKINKFSDKLTDERLIVLYDIPPEVEDLLDWAYEDSAFAVYNCRGYDFPYLPCVCPACGKAGFEFDGRGWRVCGHLTKNENVDELYLLKNNVYIDGQNHLRPMKYPEFKGGRMDDKGYSYNHPIIIEAYRKARQAQFEHGKKG